MDSDSDARTTKSKKRNRDDKNKRTTKTNWESKKEKKRHKQQTYWSKLTKPRGNPSKKLTPAVQVQGRAYTVSIAVAGSIIDNAQTPSLKAYLAGQVARAAAIFCVDEVIVYDDTDGRGTAGCEQMARIPVCGMSSVPPETPLSHPSRSSRGSLQTIKDGSLVNVGLDRDVVFPRSHKEFALRCQSWNVRKGSDSRLLKPQSFDHLLIVFGGVEGLEYALEREFGRDDVRKLFEHYVNTCPSQGSRTIRTEAILI
ncbi:hypothetical protein Ocin01_19424 [Orchesella cincta]|uniref:Uncharacterized protein n=1 Tax=Orchesella cincta TaxID=48709 RepID=A0A1D2M2R2_ORCCI|nr:hypothetical protein Ocin01_19424 [Orchesella cincta]